MSLLHNPRMVTDGLVLYLDAQNPKSYPGEPTVNLIPNPTLNAYPKVGNNWGTYNTNQYGTGTFASIGTVANVTSNIVTMTANHSLRTYDVMRAQTTGGGVTANTDYYIKKISSTQFSLHQYDNTQDGSKNPTQILTSIINDVKIPINATGFPTMWYGAPHLPNSGLIKESIPNGYQVGSVTSDCLRLHMYRPDGVVDGMAYGCDAPIVANTTYCLSFWTKPVTSAAVGKNIHFSTYRTNDINAATSSAWDDTIGALGSWKRHFFTFTHGYNGRAISYFFPSAGPYSVDIANIQIEAKDHPTQFVAGTRLATDGWKDLSGTGNHGSLSTGAMGTGSVSSIRLNRTTDGISFGHKASLEPPNITVAAWINLDNIGDRHVLLTKWFGWSFEISAAGYPYFRLQGTAVYDLGTTTTITWNNWWYITASFNDDTDTRKIYLNGALSNTVADTGTISYSQGGFNIPYVNNPTYASGKIAMVSIYNKALSDTEVRQNFNATKGRFGL